MLDRIFEPLRIVAALAVGAGVVLTWAVFIHAPAQYQAGQSEAEIRLSAATHEAAKGITDEVERARFLRRQCITSGRVYDLVSGECVG